MQSGNVIAEIERLNWSLTTITDITRVLVRAKTEHEVFLAACEAATRHDYYQLAWIGLPRQDAARSVVIGASAGRDKGYVKDLHISWGDVPLGRGPTGTAIRTGKLQICNQGDPNFTPWTERMRSFGLNCSLSVPIRLPNGSIIAAMTVYSHTDQAFGAREADLFAQLGDDIGFGIDMLRTRAAYRDALAYSEQQDRRIQMLAAALESSADGMIITDRTERIFSINSAFTRMTGFDVADICGKNPATLMIGGGPALVPGDVFCRRKEGGSFPARIGVSAVRDEQGQDTHHIVTLQDLSEVKRAEEAIRAEKLFSDSMMESTPGIIYFYDRDGQFYRWNNNFSLISGYSDSEIAKMHPLDFFHAEDKLKLKLRIEEVFEHGQSWVEAPFLTKSGKTIPYFFTGRRVDIGGRDYLVGMGIDMSDGKCVGGLPPRAAGPSSVAPS
jgi:PAS domain S-box-containing protein